MRIAVDLTSCSVSESGELGALEVGDDNTSEIRMHGYHSHGGRNYSGLISHHSPGPCRARGPVERLRNKSSDVHLFKYILPNISSQLQTPPA